jgi:hypothetical protein
MKVSRQREAGQSGLSEFIYLSPEAADPMHFNYAQRIAAFLILILFSVSADAKEWRKSFIDSYVSVEVPWGMDNTDSAGTRIMQQYFGSSALIITRTETGNTRPADREELNERYSAVISKYVADLHGKLSDSTTFVSNGIIGKKIHVAYRQNDSDFVAEVIFFLGNNRLYTVQYQHAVSAAPVPEAERAMNSVQPTKSFKPDRQFEKKKRSDMFERGFAMGQAAGYLIAVCAIAFFLFRWIRRNRSL